MPFRKIAGFIAVLACFCLLVGLGLWQLHRLEWKENLLAALAASQSLPAVDFVAALSHNSEWPNEKKYGTSEFTHVSLSGTVISKKPLFLYGRTLDGIGGVHVLYVVETFPDNIAPHGLHILLDRGFLPFPIDEARATSLIELPADGLLRFATGKRWYDLPNDPKNRWLWIDPKAMGQALGINDIDSIYVEALKSTAPNGPVPTASHLSSNLPNNHLQYAITWFSLACVLLVMYSVWLARSIGKKRNERL